MESLTATELALPGLEGAIVTEPQQGHWIERGMPIPGETVVRIRETKPAKPRSRRSVWVDRCTGCGKRRPIVAWGMCEDCLEEERQTLFPASAGR